MAEGRKRRDAILSGRADIDKSNPGTDSYVVDSFSTIRRPKLKFNFTVSFKLREPYASKMVASLGDKVVGERNMLGDNATGAGSSGNGEVNFILKQASRPNPTINYADVNYYNYRTKVATKMDYGTMMLTLYDDAGQRAHDLFEFYLKGVSPIANVPKDKASDLYNGKNGPKNKAFNIDGTGNQLAPPAYDGGTGSIGPLPPGGGGGESGIIESISIRHWFFSELVSRGDDSNMDDSGIDAQPQGNSYDPANIRYVEYNFLNPKIVNMTLDELDMTQSDANTVMMNFVYDSVYINAPHRNPNADPPRQEVPEENAFTLSDVLSRARDAERLVRKFRRLDTIPDISVLSTVSPVVEEFLPPINIDLPDNLDFTDSIKPDVDIPILDNFI